MYDKVDPDKIIEELKKIIERLKDEKRLLEKILPKNNEKNISNSP